jgi:uncharacterized RDD family membrane protein YckC
MENITIQEPPEKTTTYAGFWWRFLAYIIDRIIIGFASSFIIIPFALLLGLSAATFENMDKDSEEALMYLLPMFGAFSLLIIAVFVIQWLYYAIMESSSRQATLGKMLLGIKVTDMEGNRITFARASGRYFGKIISGLIMEIGYIIAGFTERKQALHDMLASCLVIKED